MKYIGNKQKLLNEYKKIFKEENLDFKNKIILDGFLGTGSFSKLAVDLNVKKIYAYEPLKSMCYYAKYNILGINKKKFNLVKNYFLTENKNDGYFFKNFSETSGRRYFTDENSKKIDNFLSNWTKLDDVEKGLGIDMIDKVSNTSGTYGAFLKIWRPAALKKIENYELKNCKKKFKNLTIVNGDVMTFNKTVDIAYFDPPYNTRQYGSYYHVLERIVDKKQINFSSKTGVLKSDANQNFSKKNEHKLLIQFLLKKIKAKIVIFSYNNEGILSEKDWISILKDFSYKIYSINYKRFKTNSITSTLTNNNDQLKEILIIIRKS